MVGRPGVLQPTLGSTLDEMLDSGTNASCHSPPLVMGLACIASRLPLRSCPLPGTLVGRTELRGAAAPPIHGRACSGDEAR